MAKLSGSIDQLGRPLVRIGLPRGADDLLAMVDTGFNGDLMMSGFIARQLKVTVNDARVHVELGTGQIEAVRNGTLDITWMGLERRAKVLVSEHWQPPKPDVPVAMIGTRLLRPHLLTIDFDADTVEIEAQA